MPTRQVIHGGPPQEACGSKAELCNLCYGSGMDVPPNMGHVRFRAVAQLSLLAQIVLTSAKLDDDLMSTRSRPYLPSRERCAQCPGARPWH